MWTDGVSACPEGKMEGIMAGPCFRRLVPAFHNGGMGSILGQRMWDLWWTE